MVEATRRRVDRPLVIEVGLVLVLIGLAMLLYWRPASDGDLSPNWWNWLALAAVFFSILALHSWRVRQRSHRALHEAIREGTSAGVRSAGTDVSSGDVGATTGLPPDGAATARDDRTESR